MSYNIKFVLIGLDPLRDELYDFMTLQLLLLLDASFDKHVGI